jgi:hypothetical protein
MLFVKCISRIYIWKKTPVPVYCMHDVYPRLCEDARFAREPREGSSRHLAPACSVGWWLMAGAGLFWEKSTAGWLLVAGSFWEKSTAGWSHTQNLTHPTRQLNLISARRISISNTCNKLLPIRLKIRNLLAPMTSPCIGGYGYHTHKLPQTQTRPGLLHVE